MKLNHKHKMKLILFSVLFFTLLWTVPAGANTQYGILGQTAPELDLNTWIDGNGIKIEPITLSAYRGKVVYLYFFQNW